MSAMSDFDLKDATLPDTNENQLPKLEKKPAYIYFTGSHT